MTAPPSPLPGRRVRVLRGAFLGTLTASALAVSAGCLDRPVAPATPKTNNVLTDRVEEKSVDKIDILFMIDNSASMADKQVILGRAIPDLVGRLVTPSCGTTDSATNKFTAAADQPAPDPSKPLGLGDCPTGQGREFTPINDIHIGVVSSSLGDHGADQCFISMKAPSLSNNPTFNDQAHLLKRTPRTSPTDYSFTQPNVPTYGDEGFLAWDPTGMKNSPPGESDKVALSKNFTDIVLGADQAGCGYEAQMEAWYRFLIEPNPPATITHARGADGEPDFQAPVVVDGTDAVLLKQRADFLRPDSLVAVISLSDENDCSVIDGTLPGKVCNHTKLDKAGAIAGCQKDNGSGTLVDCDFAADGSCGDAWPATYNTQLNFNNGAPFPLNWIVAQLGIPSNLGYPTPPGNSLLRLLPGSTACDTDWGSPDCKSCLNNDVATSDPKCKAAFATWPSSDEDPYLLRMWETRRRFGVDFLYPLQRYVDGLKNAQVYDRNGYLVQNPLFDDLPYNAAQAAGKPLTRPKFAARPSNLVFYAAIAGVPWQDIARDPKDLSKGYKPAVSADPSDPDLGAGAKDSAGNPIKNADGSAVSAWDLILGDPFNPDGTKRKGPADPLMIETNKPRFGLGQPALKHPVTGDALGDGWNPINGNEYVAARAAQPGTKTQDLEYACIFAQPKDVYPNGKDCKTLSGMQLPCDCADWDPMTSKNPLCATPADPNNFSVGTYGTYGLNQYRAKAYPGTRYLHVLKNIGSQAIVASICSPNTVDGNAGDYGYRPAVGAIIERLKTQLTGKCLPRKLQPSADGTTPCLIIDAKMPKPTKAGDPDPFSAADIAACNKCNDVAREPLNTTQHPVDPTSLVGDVTNYRCKCAVKQYGQTAKNPAADPDLNACQTQPDPPAVTAGGWCYVDPATLTGTKAAAAEALVGKCPSTEHQKIRFVNAGTENATLFITCLGAASGQASGAAGSSSSGTGGAGGGGLAERIRDRRGLHHRVRAPSSFCGQRAT